MSPLNDVVLDEEYKLRITSKRLKSGNYQVKFLASVRDKKSLYGYLLVDANETLKNVISKIKRRLHMIDVDSNERSFDLYNMRQELIHEPNFMIFQ